MSVISFTGSAPAGPQPLASRPSCPASRLDVPPSLVLCRTRCRCTGPASTRNGSSASCATQCSRRSPVSGFCQVAPGGSFAPGDGGQGTSVQRPLLLCPRPVTAAVRPYVSLCLSQSFPSCCFPLALPTCVIEVRGISGKLAGLQQMCSSGCRSCAAG